MGARVVGWEVGGKPADDELLARAAQFLEARLAARGERLAELGARLIIDSSDFVTESGVKRGFGSSAASTVTLTVAICELAGITSEAERFELAVGAHRFAQGGRGSGYDVAASLFGGIGLFRGGEAPEFEQVEAGWLPPLTLIETEDAASTAHAVSNYAVWKATHGDEAVEFLQRSNSLIAALVRARSWAEARPRAAELAELGVWLGEQIGVSARVPTTQAARQTAGSAAAGDAAGGVSPGNDDGRLCKAVGAGSELLLCFEGDGTGGSAREVRIDRKGCTWH
jgi:phosphomevalonate kinase